MKVGHFPYRPGGNPYQQLFSESLERAGVDVVRIPPYKVLPLHRALSNRIDLLQMDWPHDWYSGRHDLTKLLKRFMYFQGLRKLQKFPCVWTAHNLAAHDATDKNDEIRMIQALVDCCDGLIVMSEAAKQSLEKNYNVEETTVIEVVPHGHYIDVYENSVSRRNARLFLGLDESARVVLSLGRILPYKGHDALISGFCEIARSGDVLIIAGPALDTLTVENLKELAKKRCPSGPQIFIQPGFIPNERLQYYYNAADVVALPFKDILNSGGLLLAMSFGRVIVAPDIESIAEVACKDGYFSYNAHSNNSLRSALRKALAVDDRGDRSQKILKFTAEHYSWDKVGIKAKSLYSGILAGYK